MNEPQVDKLTKLLELVQNDAVSTKDVERFLLMVLEVIKQAKEGFDDASALKIAEISSILEKIQTEHKEILAQLEKQNKGLLSAAQKEISEARKFLAEVKTIKATPGAPGKDGKDGKDADENLIIERVLDKLPEFPQPDTGESIVSKINDLPIDDPELLIDAKHIKNFPAPKGILAAGNRYISQMVDGQFTNTASIEFIMDGGGDVLTTGIKGDLRIDFNCTIQSWTLLADQSGSVEVDVWKDTFANFPPLAGDSITGSSPPTLSSESSATSSTLTGWTTSINAGDILRFNINSVSTIQRLTLSLKIIKT